MNERVTIMKKTYKLENLDCAACAAKMEAAIGKIKGVEQATISFLTQKLTLEVTDQEQLDLILQEAGALCRKIEPACRIQM